MVITCVIIYEAQNKCSKQIFSPTNGTIRAKNQNSVGDLEPDRTQIGTDIS